MPSVKEIYHKIDDVRIEADSINLNVDGLEALAATQQADVAAIKADLSDGIPVSVSSSTLPSGAATSANQTTANTSLSNIDTDLGAPADSAASTDTGSFSLISLFKRLLSTKLPNSSGGRVPVDGSGVTQPVSGTITSNAGTGTFTTSDRGATGEATISSFTSTTSATLKASNASRKLLTIFNEGSGNLHILYGSGTASTTNYSVRVSAGDYLEIDKYTGQVTAIFATAGTARITEIT